MAFQMSMRSQRRLEGVHHDLVAVVREAIAITEMDFTVGEGVRTAVRQAELVRTGASRTMDSRHLTGHAVDLFAWHQGIVSWHFGHYYAIAWAMSQAAAKVGVPLRWGGCWMEIHGITSPSELPQLVSEYSARQTARHRDVFTDGPHFELPRRAYP